MTCLVVLILVIGGLWLTAKRSADDARNALANYESEQVKSAVAESQAATARRLLLDRCLDNDRQACAEFSRLLELRDEAEAIDSPELVPGPRGFIGPQGPVGPPGRPGADGLTPRPARPGTDGQNGLNGADGSNGVDGSQGPTGPTGPVGPPGEPGKDGRDGSEGPVGPAGPAGPSCPEGTSLQQRDLLAADGTPVSAYVCTA